MFHVIVNIHLMVGKVIQINNGIMIDDNVIAKNQRNVIHKRRIILEIGEEVLLIVIKIIRMMNT